MPLYSTTQHQGLQYVDDDDVEQADVWVCNPLYTLSNKDCVTISQPNGWLRDSVINASQLLLLQDHPNIAGLQPPALQELRAFKAHSDKFVQVKTMAQTVGCLPLPWHTTCVVAMIQDRSGMTPN